MRTDSRYRLCTGVQVRSEKFGLLFYNYAGPKIYFVPSRDLVDDGFFFKPSIHRRSDSLRREKERVVAKTNRVAIVGVFAAIGNEGTHI